MNQQNTFADVLRFAAGCRACTVGYDLRIVFEYTKHEGQEAVLLPALGTHDEVY